LYRCKKANFATGYFNYACHPCSHHFSKHYISEPNTRVLASFRAISAALHAAKHSTTLPFSVAVVASACVRFHAVVVGVLVLALAVACFVQHPASTRVFVPAAKSLAAWV
jgi:hypothetical protein